MAVLDIPTAPVFRPLLNPARDKGAWGGRGSGKSHFFAGLLVEDGLRFPGDAGEGMRAICGREIQKSLKDSAKHLIETKLSDYGLGSADGFKIYADRIETPKDGLIVFQGLQDHTADTIKSFEGFHRFWGEEAHTLSNGSVNLIRPTIRWENLRLGLKSELWWSWNPRSPRDAVDVMLRGEGKPSNSTVIQTNWSDNPWFPNVLEDERQDCLKNTPDQYDHIWQGGYATVLSGAYYAAALNEAKAKGRIGRVAADPLMTYRAFWDIGGSGLKADATAIWIAQFVAREIRVLDYYEAVGQPLAAHVEWLRSRGYAKALCVLPWDGGPNEKVFDISYQSALKQAGFETQVVPKQGAGAAKLRIEAARRLFPSIWFNEDTTTDGRAALGWYHERKSDDVRGIGLGPEHDWCLAACTQVLTPDGWQSVQDLRVHDQVLTPTGAHSILRSGIVRETKEWMMVNGIKCTPEHRFFTKRGLVAAEDLSSRDVLWTLNSWGLHILAFLCVTWRLGLKTAITSATREANLGPTGTQSSFTAWCMRLCMAQFRKGMKSIMSMAIPSTMTLATSPQLNGSSIEANTSRSRGLFANAVSAAKTLVAIRRLGRDAARDVSALTTRVSSENAEPAYNLTVEGDECYFVRGGDGVPFLVSNSSHGADAFGLMCIAYEAPQEKRKAASGRPMQLGWMG